MPGVSPLGRQAEGSREDVGGAVGVKVALRPGTLPSGPWRCLQRTCEGPALSRSPGKRVSSSVLATFQTRMGLVRRSDGGANHPSCAGGFTHREGQGTPGSSLTSLRVFSPQSCQADLVKDNGHKYFLSVLADPYMPVRTSPFRLGRGDTRTVCHCSPARCAAASQRALERCSSPRATGQRPRQAAGHALGATVPPQPLPCSRSFRSSSLTR